jgi:hypothetical protein
VTSKKDLVAIDELVGQALAQLGGREALVRVELPSKEIPLVEVDAIQVERALVNLLENGLRFSPEDQDVVVRVTVSPIEVVLRVENGGPPLAERDLERIFEPFERAADVEGRQGAGLGLAIARGFAEANGGRIWAESPGPEGALGFESTAGIDSFLPIFMFVILFGLSMDYHVFIISRIREAYDRGMSTENAIASGIKSTAGVVTSAAVVMVCVFAVFATLSILIFKQFGVGLAAAILIDATIVRAVLLPGTMKLLGDWNWYLPSWLEWLPHLEHGGSETIKAPTVPTPTA